MALTDIDLTGWDTGNVEYFYDTFNYCPELTTIKGIENFNTEKALSFSQMLASCNALTSLDLSGWKTTAATGFSYMFSYDENLEAIYVGEGWTTAAAEYSNDMFYGCTSIVGQDGTVFDSNCIDATKAHYGTGGYLRKKQILLGDVNGDGKVTPADAIMILYHYFGVVQTDFIEAAANVNGDENISPADAIEALYIYFGATAGARSSSPAKDTVAPRDPE